MAKQTKGKKRKKASAKRKKITVKVSTPTAKHTTEAGEMAHWGGFTWKITPSMVQAIENFSTEMEYDVEKKQKKKRTLSLPYTIYRAFGTDPKGTYDAWYAALGQKNGLYIGATKFGPGTLQLTKASMSDIHVSQGGIIASMKIQLDFAEP